jgi:hypothetical protein
MHHWKLRIVALVAIVILAEAPAFAQGMPGMGGGGMGGGNMRRPTHKRKTLRKNSSPVLSPALNMIPGASTTFEGQFLMRTLPNEKLNRSVDQNTKMFDNVQNQINKQESEIKSGIGKTGHSSRFMNYGGYYSMGGGGGGSGGRGR